MIKIKLTLALLLLTSSLVAWGPAERCADGQPPIIDGGTLHCPNGWG